MVDAGRDDFARYLAEILDISEATAREKMKGERHFKQPEIATLTDLFELTAEEVKYIFFGG